MCLSVGCQPRRTFSGAVSAYWRIGARRGVKYVWPQSQNWDRARLSDSVQRNAARQDGQERQERRDGTKRLRVLPLLPLPPFLPDDPERTKAVDDFEHERPERGHRCFNGRHAPQYLRAGDVMIAPAAAAGVSVLKQRLQPVEGVREP